jgi:hypothetical protein
MLGGLIGGGIVNGIANSSAASAALNDPRVQPLQAALQGYDVDSALDTGLRPPLGSISWLQGASFDTSKLPAEKLRVEAGEKSPSFLLVQSDYVMSQDLRGLLIFVDVSLYDQGIAQTRGDTHHEWLNDPVYTNRLIYQSALMPLVPKTAADSAMFKAQVEKDYDLDAINKELADIKGKDSFDPKVRDEREDAQKKLKDRDAALADAESPDWTSAEIDQKLQQMWTADGGAALKQALQAGAAEIGRMLQADLTPHAVPGDKPGDAVVSTADGRTELYLADGTLESVVTGDTLHTGFNKNLDVNKKLAAPAATPATAAAPAAPTAH